MPSSFVLHTIQILKRTLPVRHVVFELALIDASVLANPTPEAVAHAACPAALILRAVDPGLLSESVFLAHLVPLTFIRGAIFDFLWLFFDQQGQVIGCTRFYHLLLIYKLSQPMFHLRDARICHARRHALNPKNTASMQVFLGAASCRTGTVYDSLFLVD